MNKLHLDSILTHIDIETGSIGNQPVLKRYLSDLRGSFHDVNAFETALELDNPLVYTVAAVEPGADDGDLHYGLGVIYPGKIGDEYHLTKGHLHSWRPAAEFYFGLKGKGVMLLEDESTSETRMVTLEKDGMVYVPGFTAHRTINTGTEPLVYIGIYPAKAGHDYGIIAERNFKYVVIERDGKPTLIERSAL